MTVDIPTLLMLVGAFHGVVLSMLLVGSSRNRRLGNLLLALMLVCYTLPLLKVTLQDLGFFHHYGLWPWPIELLYGLGPSLYLYSKTVTNPQYKMKTRDLAHFVPVFLEVAYYLSPLFTQQRYFNFSRPEGATHLIWMIQQAGAVVSIFTYLALTNRRLWMYSQWVKANYSDLHRRTLRWLQTPVALYTVFFLLWFTLRGVDIARFGDSLPPRFYQPLLVFLSLSTYWIGTRGYLDRQPATAGFSDNPGEPEEPTDHEALAPIFHDLQSLMLRDKPYLQNDLSLQGLADRLSVNPRHLSKVINTQSEMNFYDFVNRYRIEEVKHRLASPNTSQNLLDLAYDCGFGSKATFNHVFKKQTGVTPSRYRKQRLTELAMLASQGETS